jgi:hypothetical protein
MRLDETLLRQCLIKPIKIMTRIQLSEQGDLEVVYSLKAKEGYWTRKEVDIQNLILGLVAIRINRLVTIAQEMVNNAKEDACICRTSSRTLYILGNKVFDYTAYKALEKFAEDYRNSDGTFDCRQYITSVVLTECVKEIYENVEDCLECCKAANFNTPMEAAHCLLDLICTRK